MSFQFEETMAGTVEWDAEHGTRHPFRFEITAQAGAAPHLEKGQALVRGKLWAPPIAEGVGVEGILTIRPLVQRIIRYELTFTGDDGKHYEMVGQKDIRFRAPLRTFTYLPAEILDEEHRRVATCEAIFDLKKDGWAFFKSFRPLP